ncbi:DUF5681 domain-containing protein [Geothrix terrae]|uniref:DUF5681 domain-containing protein n=1 Tax=Geothrix terrae TaxID=2922720 RepID=UPI001FAB7C59|nr:DUF5681 domain-containing protein [Geothrix terrae]
MAEEKDYQVGYGRPPKVTQFQKGQSGNPKGRPKGSLNAATLMQELMAERISVVEKGGQKKVMPMMEVVLRRLVNKAASGDLKAAPLVLRIAEQGLADLGEETPSTERDQAHLQGILLRMRTELAKGDSGPKGAE